MKKRMSEKQALLNVMEKSDIGNLQKALASAASHGVAKKLLIGKNVLERLEKEAVVLNKL